MVSRSEQENMSSQLFTSHTLANVPVSLKSAHSPVKKLVQFVSHEQLPRFNPFNPRSDQYVNSLYNFNTLSSRQVMRINKIIN